MHFRYVWEVRPNKMTYKQASDAYYQAFGMCQWNFKPTDILSLQVVMSYTIHLMNSPYTEKKAIVILETAINNAQKDLDSHDPTNKPLVESLLKNLKENVIHFQDVAVELTITEFFELFGLLPKPEDFEEEQTETEPDDTV